MLVKCSIQNVSKFGKLSNGHRARKGQFSFQPQKRAVPKNVQTPGQLRSFLMLVRLCSKTFKLAFSHTKAFVQSVKQKMFFLEFPCFLHNPTNAGNLISGSSAFSKFSLNIWKFMVHGLLKPDLENFEHYFASI